jgi:hypothetical protein
MDRQRLREYAEAQRRTKDFVCHDEREREILTNMYFAACSFIGGLENCLWDYAEDEPEYISAKNTLSDKDYVRSEVKYLCMDGFYGCGLEGPQRAYQKHYNLAGNEFIDKCADAVVTAMGY